MPESIPATHSILSTAALADFVQRQYDIAPICECLLLARGVNDSYLIRVAGAQYVLRVYQLNWRSTADIAYELDILAHLDCRAVRVATALPRTDGSVFATIAAPEGERFIALFHYAAGGEIRYGDDAAPLAQAYGRAVAQVHLQSDGFHSAHARFELDLVELLERPIGLIQAQLAARPADAAYLVDLASRLSAYIAQHAATLETGFCHGDFHGQNAHIDAEQAITWFDFDCCGRGWRAYDLAVFFWQMRSTNAHQQRCPEFLRAYLAQRPLAEQDLAAIPYFVAIRHLWWIALNIQLAPSMGLGWMNERFWDMQLKFCRELDVECFTQNVREVYALDVVLVR